MVSRVPVHTISRIWQLDSQTPRNRKNISFTNLNSSKVKLSGTLQKILLFHPLRCLLTIPAFKHKNRATTRRKTQSLRLGYQITYRSTKKPHDPRPRRPGTSRRNPNQVQSAGKAKDVYAFRKFLRAGSANLRGILQR